MGCGIRRTLLDDVALVTSLFAHPCSKDPTPNAPLFRCARAIKPSLPLLHAIRRSSLPLHGRIRTLSGYSLLTPPHAVADAFALASSLDLRSRYTPLPASQRVIGMSPFGRLALLVYIKLFLKQFMIFIKNFTKLTC